MNHCHKNRSVAQPGSATALGAEGPRFKSLHSDQIFINKKNKDCMYLVYWTQVQNDVFVAKFQDFPADQMVQALKYAESLRARRRGGAAICHITISAENPDSVGQAGVAQADSSYSWKKRRI